MERIKRIHENLADQKAHYKQEWKQVGDKRIFARSKWEYKYAVYLQTLKESGDIKDWEHEPEEFWFDKIKRGVRSYKPDFRVIHKNDATEYVEVKGYMDAKSKTKIKRMKIYHPQIKLRVVDGEWFKSNGKALKILVAGFEDKIK